MFTFDGYLNNNKSLVEWYSFRDLLNIRWQS